MKKYIIQWNAGFGPNFEEIEAENEDYADRAAYEAWREEAENNSDYGVVGESTEQLKEEYEID